MFQKMKIVHTNGRLVGKRKKRLRMLCSNITWIVCLINSVIGRRDGGVWGEGESEADVLRGSILKSSNELIMPLGISDESLMSISSEDKEVIKVVDF